MQLNVDRALEVIGVLQMMGVFSSVMLVIGLKGFSPLWILFFNQSQAIGGALPVDQNGMRVWRAQCACDYRFILCLYSQHSGLINNQKTLI